MEDHTYHHQDPDAGVYGTGRTSPPKSRNGLVAVMLIIIIFLCGIITLLGVMNVKMLFKLQSREENELFITFTEPQTVPQQEAPTSSVPIQQAPTSSVPIQQAPENASISLQQTPNAVDNRPAEDGISLQEIYARNIGSVVSITTTQPNSTVSGTGVVASQDGYIITNAHVVENASAISVQLTDQRVFSADIVGMDILSDLAVLYVDATDLTPAQFGDSSNLRVGDTVVAIGDPLGVEFRGTCTDGIISAINRDVNVDGYTMTLIQTNAALNSGNSGGPLINCYGQVIGINTMKIGAFTDKAGVEGIGFAIPSATVKQIVDQLLSQGYVSGRPTLGITGETLSVFYQHYYRLPAGLYISQVDRSSDAYDKGIQSGDILISIDDTAITTMNDLTSVVYNYQVGDTVDAVVYRGGEYYQVELALTEDKG